MEFRHGKHSVYSLNYHIVFVTKYRRPCITEEIGDFPKAEIIRLIESMEGHVSEVEYHRDHIYILAELSPKHAISEQIGVLKGITARNVKKRYGVTRFQNISGRDSSGRQASSSQRSETLHLMC